MIDQSTVQHISTLKGSNVEFGHSAGSLSAIFGENSQVKFDQGAGLYMVKGTFTDGMVEGGQSFKSRLIKVPLSQYAENGFMENQEYWQLKNLSVGGFNVSSILKAPVFIRACGVPNPPYDEFATYDSFANRSDMSFDCTRYRVDISGSFDKFDDFIALVHEQDHGQRDHLVTSGDRFLTNEFNKFYNAIRLRIGDFVAMHRQTAGVVPDADQIARYQSQAIEELRAQRTDFLGTYKMGCKIIFMDEVMTNRHTYNFFKRNNPQTGWFQADPDLLRLKRYLTVLSLSYAKNFNVILGPGTINPSLAEIK